MSGASAEWPLSTTPRCFDVDDAVKGRSLSVDDTLQHGRMHGIDRGHDCIDAVGGIGFSLVCARYQSTGRRGGSSGDGHRVEDDGVFATMYGATCGPICKSSDYSDDNAVRGSGQRRTDAELDREMSPLSDDDEEILRTGFGSCFGPIDHRTWYIGLHGYSPLSPRNSPTPDELTEIARERAANGYSSGSDSDDGQPHQGAAPASSQSDSSGSDESGESDDDEYEPTAAQRLRDGGHAMGILSHSTWDAIPLPNTSSDEEELRVLKIRKWPHRKKSPRELQ
jgi:hypothetical protein